MSLPYPERTPSHIPKAPRVPRDWNQRFLFLARTMAGFSKDPSTKVGAVAVRGKHILATGYNGLPRNVDDREHRLKDRTSRLAMTVHAEANLVSHAARHGVCLAGSTIYIWPLMCCAQCAAQLIQADVSNVVIPDYLEPRRWMESFSFARQMLAEAGIPVQTIPLDLGQRKFEPDPDEQEEEPQLTADERLNQLIDAMAEKPQVITDFPDEPRWDSHGLPPDFQS